MDKKYKIDDSDFKSDNIFNGLEGYKNYRFTVKVTNTEGLEKEESVQIKTDELGEWINDGKESACPHRLVLIHVYILFWWGKTRTEL